MDWVGYVGLRLRYGKGRVELLLGYCWDIDGKK